MPVIKYKGKLKHVFKKPIFTPVDMHNEGIPKKYSKKLLYILAKSGE